MVINNADYFSDQDLNDIASILDGNVIQASSKMARLLRSIASQGDNFKIKGIRSLEDSQNKSGSGR